jgi:hypothetical protein
MLKDKDEDKDEEIRKNDVVSILKILLVTINQLAIEMIELVKKKSYQFVEMVSRKQVKHVMMETR